jgi:hypothetical protein
MDGALAENFGIYWSPNPDVDTEVISRTERLSARNIAVPAGGLALFMVHFQAQYVVEDQGWVEMDFESSGGFIKCHGVQLELLTPPPVAV